MTRQDIVDRIDGIEAELMGEPKKNSIFFTVDGTKCRITRTAAGLRYCYRSLLPEVLQSAEELADVLHRIHQNRERCAMTIVEPVHVSERLRAARNRLFRLKISAHPNRAL